MARRGQQRARARERAQGPHRPDRRTRQRAARRRRIGRAADRTRDACSRPSPRRRFPGTLPGQFKLADTPALLTAVRTLETLRYDHPLCGPLAAELGVPKIGVAPLVGSSRCVGVVLLARSSGTTSFDDFTRDLVGTLLVQSGLAIERIRDREALRIASLHDELTGLGNRRKAQLRLQALAEGDALMMIDLDFFKRVNDDHGHARGDDALCELADYLVTVMRDEDHAYRLGGEEFLVVLSGAGDGAATAAERLRTGWNFLDPITTFSAGVAIHQAGDTSEATLARADQALYLAKSAAGTGSR